MPSTQRPTTIDRPRSSDKRPRRALIRGRDWLGWLTFALSCVAIAIFAPLPYLSESLGRLAETDTGLARHYVEQPEVFRVALYVHLVAGAGALLLTPFQGSRWVRRRFAAAHRLVGRVTIGVVLVGAASALVVAQVSYAGLVGVLGFSALGLLWGYCAIQTILAARARDFVAHQRWAVRTMALTYAAVTLRVWIAVLIVAQRPQTDADFAVAFDHAYALVPFLSWVPNIVITEWWIRRRAAARR